VRDLGAAAAFYLEATLKQSDVRRGFRMERLTVGNGECDAPQPAV